MVMSSTPAAWSREECAPNESHTSSGVLLPGESPAAPATLAVGERASPGDSPRPFRSPTLWTERLVLRPLRHADAEWLFDLRDDAFPARDFVDGLTTREVAVAFVREMNEGVAEGNGHAWAIAFRAGGPAMGVVGLGGWSPSDASGEIGFRVARTWWGKGLGGEAVRAVIEYAFGELRLRRVVAVVERANVRSMRLLARLDFRPSNTHLPCSRNAGDGEYDDVRLELRAGGEQSAMACR